MHTGVVRPRGGNMGNRRLIGAEMEGCQVRDWIVGERDMPVSMAAYGKSMVVSTLIEFELICFRDNIEQQTTWTTHLCYIIRRN